MTVRFHSAALRSESIGGRNRLHIRRFDEHGAGDLISAPAQEHPSDGSN